MTYDPNAKEHASKAAPLAKAALDSLPAGCHKCVNTIEFTDSLVRLLISTSLERRDKVSRVNRRIRGDVADCKRAARILLGRHPDYKGIPWNGPGGIDVHLAEWCGIDSESPTERVAGALVNMLTEVHELVNLASDPEVVEEQWSFHVEEIIKRYSGLLIGYDLPEIAAG